MNIHQKLRLQKAAKEAGLALAGVMILLFIYTRFGFGIPCMFRMATGLLCPGCGMTRALAQLCQGHFQEAVEYNALSVSVLPLTILYVFYRKVRYVICGDNPPHRLWERIFLSAMLAASIAYCIWHNLQV